MFDVVAVGAEGPNWIPLLVQLNLPKYWDLKFPNQSNQLSLLCDDQRVVIREKNHVISSAFIELPCILMMILRRCASRFVNSLTQVTQNSIYLSNS